MGMGSLWNKNSIIKSKPVHHDDIFYLTALSLNYSL